VIKDPSVYAFIELYLACGGEGLILSDRSGADGFSTSESGLVVFNRGTVPMNSKELEAFVVKDECARFS
jgi:hypothetical protein